MKFFRRLTAAFAITPIAFIGAIAVVESGVHPFWSLPFLVIAMTAIPLAAAPLD